jgi:hypothetical protein
MVGSGMRNGPDRIRRVGALMNLASDDPESQVRKALYAQASTTRMGRWPQRPGRLPLGRGGCGAVPSLCYGAAYFYSTSLCAGPKTP